MKTRSLFLFFLVISIFCDAQKTDKQTQTFFANFKTTADLFKYAKNNLLTLDDCKHLFKDDYAYIYYNKIKEIIPKLNKWQSRDTILSCNVTTVTAPMQDQKNNKADISKLKDGIKVYYPRILAKKERKLNYTPFVYVNNQYKPLIGFKLTDEITR